MVTVIIGNSEPGPFVPPDVAKQTADGGLPAEARNTSLIPGLPDDLAVQCLARIPRWYHGRCKLVCRDWLSVLGSELLVDVRRKAGVAEEWLYIFSSDPSVSPAQVFDPIQKKWRKLPPMPSEPFTYGLSNYSCVAVGPNLLVVGGVLFDARAYPSDQPVASARVFKYDAIRDKWSRLADMHQARGSFACAEYQGKVYVAGGGSRHAQFSSGGSRMATAEVLELGTNVWEVLPSLDSIRAGCVGFVIDGGNDPQLYVMGGYGNQHTVYGILTVDEYRRDGEVFNFSTGQWSQISNMWHELEGYRLGPVSQIGKDLYMLKGNTILKYDPQQNTWLRETNIARAEDKPGFFSLNGELYVVSVESTTFRALRRGQDVYNPKTKRWRRVHIEQMAEAFMRGKSWGAGLGTTCVVSL